jgi:hypothetical protein
MGTAQTRQSPAGLLARREAVRAQPLGKPPRPRRILGVRWFGHEWFAGILWADGAYVAGRGACGGSAAGWLDADGVFQGGEAGQQFLGGVGPGPASEQGGERPREGDGDGGVDAVDVPELFLQLPGAGPVRWHADEPVAVSLC